MVRVELLLIAGWLLSPSIMQAEVLGEKLIDFTGSLNSTDVGDSFNYSLYVVTPPPPPPPFDYKDYPSGPDPRDYYVITDLTAADDGKTFVVSPGDDPGFFDALTSGNSLMATSVEVTTPIGGGGGEGLFNSTSFHDSNVTSVDVTINSVVFDLNSGSENPLQYSFQSTLTVNGQEVPEPGTSGLLACGMGLLVFRLWRRRHPEHVTAGAP
jgi:hypothetical protein